MREKCHLEHLKQKQRHYLCSEPLACKTCLAHSIICLFGFCFVTPKPSCKANHLPGTVSRGWLALPHPPDKASPAVPAHIKCKQKLCEAAQVVLWEAGRHVPVVSMPWQFWFTVTKPPSDNGPLHQCSPPDLPEHSSRNLHPCVCHGCTIRVCGDGPELFVVPISRHAAEIPLFQP